MSNTNTRIRTLEYCALYMPERMYKLDRRIEKFIHKDMWYLLEKPVRLLGACRIDKAGNIHGICVNDITDRKWRVSQQRYTEVYNWWYINTYTPTDIWCVYTTEKIIIKNSFICVSNKEITNTLTKEIKDIEEVVENKFAAAFAIVDSSDTVDKVCQTHLIKYKEREEVKIDKNNKFSSAFNIVEDKEVELKIRYYDKDYNVTLEFLEYVTSVSRKRCWINGMSIMVIGADKKECNRLFKECGGIVRIEPWKGVK